MDLERSDVRLHYEVHGHGPVLLLSHGFGATSAMFASNLAALAERHTVVTWDLIGHGESDAPSEASAYSVSRCVDDMAGLLDAVGAERAVLGGHSLGGYLSLEFQHAFGSRVTGLVLIDTGPGYRSDESREGWNRLAERYAARLEAQGLDGLPPGDELGTALHRGPTGLVLVARNVMTQRDGHVLEALPAIEVPVLVVVGSKDEPFLGGASYMAAKIPGASLAVIEGAGHAPNVTHPDEFDTVVLDFLGRLSRHPRPGA